ncbi:hypothetical protein BUALT_Bualt17G0041700 [Buddleja alternifolia]|uniref:F-box/LRR-repeat protein 15/At3g58940/PEG3-like LRR domain-containing protein n=1 Tax=Buddleja alternifolia TaxID=168488 RepID=A0AAV6WEH7_9LAMI|nr:hypothetical protein BUALT_Bualt17G0041700 [Buddleja alternifolia]
MEKKSLDHFVVNSYLLEEIPNCYLNRVSRIDGTFEYENLDNFPGKKEKEQEENNIDRLSTLPDILCQHIVSFLPSTDARKTTFLSRRWRFIWCACASLAFDEREFQGRAPPSYHTRQNFIRFVNEALDFRQTYFNDLSIEKFKVSMRFVKEVSTYLENWIAFALERNVKELSIIAEMKDLIAIAEFFHPFRVPYPLPPAIFATKSIQYLELVFCDITNLSGTSVELPFLKNLDLINVYTNDSAFESILSGSPLIEKINLSLVFGLEKIRVFGEKLKMLVVFKCLPLEEVIVKAPNIESFLFRGKRQYPDKIDISFCKKLKFLWLQRASNFTDDLLEKITHQNPNLEIMILIHCSSLKNAVISSPNLWMFVLFKCKHLSLAKIEAPKLRAFEYSGHMINFPSLVSSCHLDAIIHMDGQENGPRWYKRLKEMFSRFDCCTRLWIRCEHDVDLIVPHEMRKRLLPQLHGLTELKIHVRNGKMNLSSLEDGIRWIYPGLKNLYVESDGSTHHFKYGGATGDVGMTRRKCRDFI